MESKIEAVRLANKGIPESKFLDSINLPSMIRLVPSQVKDTFTQYDSLQKNILVHIIKCVLDINNRHIYNTIPALIYFNVAY